MNKIKSEIKSTAYNDYISRVSKEIDREIKIIIYSRYRLSCVRTFIRTRVHDERERIYIQSENLVN